MTVPPRPDLKTATEQARARGAFTHVLDGTKHPDKLGTLDAIAAALSFPDYFGRNLDALYDCLTDLGWLPTGEHVLIWVASDVLKQADPRAYLAVHSVLSDAQRALAPGGERTDSRTLTVVLAD
ncbi:barnase inhibitor [Prauserella sp. PE36]|uniref:Barstar family protein n=1 Tax=Prauserella endophytica TaxID=1592324 RepID=A0ABY2RWD0_9PSEU|nr:MULTISPECIES: barstar family protein [Prauserella]PXY20428.1 barnase inhibitor [Prauserella coralliicola]RBM15938.1 barnase inhibitor [Prauserella sp. PE36]TKG63118.1 barstar family protein [Prauserella endophytica]